MVSFLETRKSRNLAIALYFEAALGSPPREQWLGEDGTVSHILEVFNLKEEKRRVVRRILDDYSQQKKQQYKNNYNKSIHKRYQNSTILTSFRICRATRWFFDEMHIDQEGVPTYRSKYQIRFPRDAQG